MSTAPLFLPKPSYHIDFSLFDLDRLDVSTPNRIWDRSSCPVDSEFWDDLHRAVQRVLGRLSARVQARWPIIRGQSGKAESRSFYLFSFLAFRLDGDDVSESVIVGLEFDPTASQDCVRVSGWIGGEESGRIDLELEVRSLPLDSDEILAVTLDMASRLAKHTDLIARTVLDHHPVPEY